MQSRITRPIGPGIGTAGTCLLYTSEREGMRPLAFMQTLGWVGPDVWYAHGIHFHDEELKLLAETGTGVCHCPASNMKLSSGIARIPDMLKLGVPVGLGVDGSASNDGSSLMAVSYTHLAGRQPYAVLSGPCQHAPSSVPAVFPQSAAGAEHLSLIHILLRINAQRHIDCGVSCEILNLLDIQPAFKMCIRDSVGSAG